MSSFPPVDSNFDSAPEESAGKGLAIAAIVLGILLITSPIGLILGIIALTKSGKPGQGGARNLAIGGVIASSVGMVLGCGCIGTGVMLPALGKARNAARQLKSSTQLRAIGSGLQLYAQAYKDQLPPKGSDWQALLVNGNFATDELFVSAAAPDASQASGPSYFYVPPVIAVGKIKDPTIKVIAFEDPVNFRQRGSNVLFADGHVEYLTGEALWSKIDGLSLANGTVYSKPAGAK